MFARNEGCSQTLPAATSAAKTVIMSAEDPLMPLPTGRVLEKAMLAPRKAVRAPARRGLPRGPTGPPKLAARRRAMVMG